MSQFDIGSKLKELANHSMVYGLGSVMQALLGFILIPIYTKNLSVEMYGAWALITLAGTLAGVIFYLGASSALARSFYDYEDLNERRRVVSTSLLLTVCGALLQISLGMVFRRELSLFLFNSDRYSTHIALALASAAFTFINGLFYVVLRFQRRSKVVVVLGLLTMLNGGVLILYFLVVKKYGILAPLLGEAINQFLACLVLGYFSRDLLGWRFSLHEVKVQLLYGLPTVVTGLAYYLFTAGDRYFIKRFCDLSDVGLYSLGSRVGMLIQVLLILPIGQVWTPVRMELRNKPNTQQFFERILTYYVVSGMLFSIGLSLFSREILQCLARDPGYAEAYRAVPFVVCAHLMYGLIGFFDTGIIYARRSIYSTLLFIGALVVNWLLNLFLLPRIGFIGAGVSLLLSMAVLVTGVYFVSNRLLKVPMETRRLCTSALIFVLILWTGSMLSVSLLLVSILLKIALLLVALAAFYRWVLNAEERDWLKSICLQLRLLIGKRLGLGST